MSEPHLSAEDLAAFAERRLEASRAQSIFAHLSVCALCRSTWQQALETDRSADRILDDVGSEPAHVRRTPPRRLLQALAAGLVLALIGLFLLFRTRVTSTPEIVQTSPRTTTTVPSSTTITTASTVVREERAVHPAIAEAFARGVLTPPAPLATLLATPAWERTRGNEGTALATYEPNREVVATQRPRFRFPAERGFPSVVHVFDRDREVLHSEPVDSGEWTPSTNLARGVTYTWQVESIRDGETVITPAPPAPPARFIVLDANSYRTLETARREHPENHLLLGILSARAGLRHDAERELRISANESRDPRVDALLLSVSNWPR